jgi:hypothetical protein
MTDFAVQLAAEKKLREFSQDQEFVTLDRREAGLIVTMIDNLNDATKEYHDKITALVEIHHATISMAPDDVNKRRVLSFREHLHEDTQLLDMWLTSS